MKLKVTSAFRDRNDHVTVYDPEVILEVKDMERANSLIERGLCKEFKGKTDPTYILEDAPEKEQGQEMVGTGNALDSGENPESGSNPESSTKPESDE